jgi:branched-chain amino acid transport system ATP-binding protein
MSVSAAPLLKVEKLHVAYGAIVGLHDVNFEVHSGEIVTLIGSNGAGKSTLLRALSGLTRVSSGRIWFEGEDITYERADRRVARGIAQSPEGRRVFANLSVRENLAMGAYLRRAEEPRNLERVLELFPRLRERLAQSAGTLSGGEQQMLAIGRALMAQPRVLLLDEPSLGLAPLLVQQIFAIVREIHAAGTTVVLVEQNARQALRVAQRAYVLETGNVTLEGAAGELERDDRVRAAYLGGGAH